MTPRTSQALAIKEARRQAEEKARRDEQARREEQVRRAAAEQAAAKKREQENVWATRVSHSPPAQENTNPWANMVCKTCLTIR